MSSRAGTRVRKPKASPIRSRAVPLFTTPVFPGASVPRPAVPVQNSIALHNFAEIPLFSPEQKSAPLQAKLSVGKPGDKYEQEADRVANQVVGMTQSPASHGGHSGSAASLQQPVLTHAPGLQNKPLAITPWVQRQTDHDDEETGLQAKSLIQRQTENEDEEEEKSALQSKSLVQRQVETAEEDEEDKQALQASSTSEQAPAVTSGVVSGVNAMQGRGQALSPATRAFMEPRFGHNFSHVRIHADRNAIDTSRQLNARAFTVGRDIAFGAGQYQPNTSSGRKLLAHELTHVVQQQTSPGGWRAISSSSAPPSIQRVLEPPGNCIQGIHDAMQRVVKAWCDHPSGRTCIPADTCPRLRQKIRRNQLCAQHRRAINDRCYNGGDIGHRIAERDARRAQATCMALFRTKCKRERQRERERVRVPVERRIAEWAEEVLREGRNVFDAAEEFLRDNPELVAVVVAAGLVAIIVLIADDATLVGIADDVLIPVIGALEWVALRMSFGF